ncbi:MAG TPA: RluA family pseudouridine synthase [Myxococcales bacterium]|nr:RluA family pseudouridine synthase [Myxococcales bacterium]
MKRRTLEVGPGQDGVRVEGLVRSQLQLRAAEVRALVDRGAVYVDGRRCRDGGARLRAGQKVTVVLEESGAPSLVEPAAPPPLRVLYEDAALLAVDKPAGLPAQPTPGGAPNLLGLVSERLGRQAGLVHRLDRETSGVTVFGRTAEATRELAAQLREGTARKRYLAAVKPGLAAAGRIDLPISKDPSRPGRYRATRAANGVPALTEYARLFESADHALVSLLPRTGRTHQLRAHLVAVGCPIAGDRRYGGQDVIAGGPAERCLLHAHALQISCGGKTHLFIAPLPPDLGRIFEADGVRPPEGAP